MNTGTKISVNKGLNKRLNVVAAQLEMPKTQMLERIASVPVKELRAFLKRFEQQPNDTVSPQGGA